MGGRRAGRLVSGDVDEKTSFQVATEGADGSLAYIKFLRCDRLAQDIVTLSVQKRIHEGFAPKIREEADLRNGDEPEDYPRAYIYRQVVRAKLYIDAHFAENIDLAHIADEAFYSRHHFLRLFKSMYGMTPQQYRRRVRIEHAKARLAEGDGVTEVCCDVGFESLSTFSATFKEIVGVPPSIFARDAGLLRDKVKSQPLMYVPGCFTGKPEAREIAIRNKHSSDVCATLGLSTKEDKP